jgi:hypothetical protein
MPQRAYRVRLVNFRADVIRHFACRDTLDNLAVNPDDKMRRCVPRRRIVRRLPGKAFKIVAVCERRCAGVRYPMQDNSPHFRKRFARAGKNQILRDFYSFKFSCLILLYMLFVFFETLK